MRNPEEIIFEIDDIANLRSVPQKHTVKRADLAQFNEHLKLCKPKHKRLFFKGVTPSDWNTWAAEGTEYYLLYADEKPVARCAIEKYSDTAWEAADVKTVPAYRNQGLSKELVCFVTRKILEQNRTATCSTLPTNHAMLHVIRTLGYRKADIGKFFDVTIEPLSPADYPKCANIWNMQAQPLAETWKKEIESGNRLVFIYKINGAFIGEGALVSDAHDADYTIPGQRVYISRMIVKKEYRNRGIGGEILAFLIRKAKETGYTEITLGVDQDNLNALHLYRKHGFTEVLFEGTDENGAYYKLLKRI